MSGGVLRAGVGVEVRVPASSANLGPGFDSVGCALGVWDTCRATLTADAGLVVTVDGEGAGVVPLDATHLVHRAMQAAWGELGVAPPERPAPRVPQRGAPRARYGVVRDRHRHGDRRRPGSARRLLREVGGRRRPRLHQRPGLPPRGSPRQRVGERPRRGDAVVVGRRRHDDVHGAPAGAPRRRAGRLRARRPAVDGEGPLGAAAAGAPRRRRRQLGPRGAPRPRARRLARTTCSRRRTTGCTRRRGAARTRHPWPSSTACARAGTRPSSAVPAPRSSCSRRATASTTCGRTAGRGGGC